MILGMLLDIIRGILTFWRTWNAETAARLDCAA
jgi:hypothetical protein